MNKIVYFLTFLVVFFVASCKTKVQKEALKQTEMMLEKIDFLQKRIDSLDFEKYSKIYDTTKIYNNFFKKLPPEFEVSNDEMDLMYDYGMIEKCFKKLRSHHIDPISKELKKSQSQIKNLQHDIKRGFLKDDEILSYVHDEDSILRKIEVVLDGEIKFAKAHEKRFSEIHSEIVKLKKKLEEKYF